MTKRKAPTKAQKKLREWTDRRNIGIQAAACRPPDGVTFGKGQPPGADKKAR